MCTLIVLDRIAPGYPLVVASNRDEFYARPAAPPARVDPRKPPNSRELLPYVAPQDLEAGGTWMGLNAAGLFVGLTNRATESRRTNVRSRGLLVQDALTRRGASEVLSWLGNGLEATYNPFHLLAADGGGSCLLTSDGDREELRELEPGVHVVCNRERDDPSSDKVRALETRVAELDLEGGIDTILRGLVAVLGGHVDSNPHEGACVHTPGYGTRSSTLLAVGDERWRCWHAEGPPCNTKYSNLTRLLDELRQDAPSQTWGERN